jgi:hypothetical protein
VAAFGKHPGWNDHIDDLGLDTQRLIEFKRKLYIDGIGTCVESGRWDKLEPDQLLDGYGHVFLYRGGGDLIIGRMWSSQDGKGRSRYPMVLCVHTRGIGVDEALPMLLPALERAQTQCEATTAAGDVIRIVNELGEALRAKAAALPARRGEPRVSGATVRELADHAAMGPARRGFHRVMYQMDRELAPFLGGQSTTRSRNPDIISRQLRVPACWSEPDRAIAHWYGLFSLRVESLFPMMIILPIGRGWLDVIVGEPSGPELFCIRASSKLVPPVTEVPYTIEADQAFRYEQFVRDAVASDAKTAAAPTPDAGASAWSKPKVKPGGHSSRNTLVIALVLAALLVGSVAWLLFGQGGKKPSPSAPGPAAPAAGASGLAPRPWRGFAGRALTSAALLAIRPSCTVVLDGIDPGDPPPAAGSGGEGFRTQDEIVKDSAGINAFWRAQRDRMLAFYPGADNKDMLAHAQRLERALVDLDRRTPGTMIPAPASGWAAEMNAELGRRREVRFAEAFGAWKGQLIDPADEGIRQALDQTQAAGVRDAEALGRLTADLGLIERAMDQGLGLDAALAGGASINATINRWESAGLLRDRGIRSAAAPVLDRVHALREIAVESDTARLLDRVRDPAQPAPEVAVAVWRRLSGRPGVTWPATAEDLTVEANLGRQLRGLIDRFPDQARAATLREELAAEQKRRLIRMLTTADEPSEFDAAASAMAVVGLKAEEFEPRIRFNLLVHEFKKSLVATGANTPGPDDAQVVQLARQFVEQARALPAGLAFLGDAAATIGIVDRMASGERVAAPAMDPTMFGPGATGRYSGRLDGDRLVFTPIRSTGGVSGATGGAKLEFIRVEPGSGPGFFLGTTEVSVEMFVTLAKNSGQSGSIASLLPAIEPGLDPRVGPRTWEWDARRTTLLPARQWLSIGLGNAEDQYAPGAVPARPTMDCPIQGLSPQAAASAAAMAGCRLPTPAEWEAAMARFGSPVDPAACNLRDQTWARHKAFVDKQLVAGRNVQQAEAGSYSPGPGVSSTDDGILWLAPVGVGAGDQIHHLKGNVAEYLLDAGGQGAPTAPESEAGRAFFAQFGGRVSVAGGSALAEPTTAANPVPMGLDAAAEGFADVGFRLAFSGPSATASAAPLGTQMAEALTPTPYLRPR